MFRFVWVHTKIIWEISTLDNRTTWFHASLNPFSLDKFSRMFRLNPSQWVTALSVSSFGGWDDLDKRYPIVHVHWVNQSFALIKCIIYFEKISVIENQTTRLWLKRVRLDGHEGIIPKRLLILINQFFSITICKNCNLRQGWIWKKKLS